MSTLKSVADVRKHVNSGTVELPATLLGLSRLFNNYCHLLDVLFGQNCPHLVHTRGIRDALDNNEADLETRITQKLCLHLLWRVHHDSRNFFLPCKRWAPPAPAPKSSLASTVDRLVNDCNIYMMLICPEAKFLGGTAPTKIRRCQVRRQGAANLPLTQPFLPGARLRSMPSMQLIRQCC